MLVVATRKLTFASDSKPGVNPCNLSQSDLADLVDDSNTDVHARREYVATVLRMLREEKFDQLDCLADHARSGKERFSGGIWKLHTIYMAESQPFVYPVTSATATEWSDHLKKLLRWVSSNPKSITARIALAEAYIAYAWAARGNGYTNTVSDNGWKLFSERTGEAERILQAASVLPSKCPEWYYAMMSVAQNEDWGVSRMRAFYDDGMKVEPGYYYYAQKLDYYLLPKWEGQPGDAEKFAQEAADHVGGDEGDILYYRMGLVSMCGCDEDPKLSVQRIERGYEASEKIYGLSLLDLNEVTHLVVNVKENDALFAQKALARIGEQWDEEKWESRHDFDVAKQWADQWAPQVAATRAAEADAHANAQTADGARYKVIFEKAYIELLQQCVRSDGAGATEWNGKFEAITHVGANGYFDNGWITSMTPVVQCMYRKARVSNAQKSPMFPPPPTAPYWIRLDLDWADFAPVAAK
jgi:hypothetical protein